MVKRNVYLHASFKSTYDTHFLVTSKHLVRVLKCLDITRLQTLACKYYINSGM